jgi:ferredoxin-NADP reductase
MAPGPSAWRLLDRVLDRVEAAAVRSGAPPPPAPTDRTIAVRVAAAATAADGVRELRLTADTGRGVRVDLPPWLPGCHIDLLLPSGRVRQYSLCGHPGEPSYRIAVRQVPGGDGSTEVHRLQVGDRLAIRGPRNAFPFVAAPRYFFLAGGIGITPILPMVAQAARRGADWHLVYTGRSRASMPFLDELTALAELRVSDGGGRPGGAAPGGVGQGGRLFIRPDDEYGEPAGAAASLFDGAPAGASAYGCGPPPLIAALRRELPQRGIAGVHYERFSAPPVLGGRPFTVLLARTGRRVPVAADQTALSAVRAVRPSVPYSCQQGFCGTCRVRVLGGGVEHRDQVLTPAEREVQMMLCVSRAAPGQDELVIDL